MSSNITIVSAFFNIGRGDLADKELARSVEQYFDYFRLWARIQNRLVVYTEPCFVDKIKEIRSSFGLDVMTEVIAIDDIYQIEPEMFTKMQTISNNQRFRNYRFFIDAMSNNANYDYVMLLKYWCLMRAHEQGYVTDADMVAWVDFGFNHGGDLYYRAEEFDYKWEYPFSDKIQLFALKNPDEELGLRNVQLQTDCIMGAMLLVPGHLCCRFWEMIRDSMKALFLLDCIDDDQQLLLMAYRMQPELFEVHISTWFMPLKEFGGVHLSTREYREKSKNVIEHMKDTLRVWLKRTPNARFLNRLSRDMER